MDSNQVAVLRALLSPSGWLERIAGFARSMRTATRTPGGLLVVGTPEEEPWHFTAHLAEESRLSGIPELAPTLVRWSPPVQAPPHLRVDLSRLEAAQRGDSVLVVSQSSSPDQLLERVHDARHSGATIFAFGCGDRSLEDMAHESLSVPPADAPLTFDAAQHLLSTAAGESGKKRQSVRSMRAHLASALDVISGVHPGR